MAIHIHTANKVRYQIIVDVRRGIADVRLVMLQRGSEEFRTMHVGGVAAWPRTPRDGNNPEDED